MERLVGTLYTPEDEINFILSAETRIGPLQQIEISPAKYEAMLKNSPRYLHHPVECGGSYMFTKDIVTANIHLQQLANEPGNRIEYREEPAPWPVQEGEVQ